MFATVLLMKLPDRIHGGRRFSLSHRMGEGLLGRSVAHPAALGIIAARDDSEPLRPGTGRAPLERSALKRALAVCCSIFLLTSSTARSAVAASPTAAKKPASPPTYFSTEPGMEQVIQVWQSDHSSLERFYDLPRAPARFDRLETLFKEWQDKLEKLDFETLDQQGRIDYLLLRNRLRSELARLSLERSRLAQMEELLPFRTAIQNLERARWRMEPLDNETNASTVATISDQVKAVRKRLERGKKEKEKKPEDKEEKTEDAAPLKIPASLARRAAGAVGELRATLKSWFLFYDGYQPDFSWWIKKPYDGAASALEDYAKFLREEIAGIKGKDEDPLLGDPIGADALADDLAAEMIPYTPDELIAIGEKEFAWCEVQMKKASKQMGLGDDWKAALAKVKTDFVPPGKQDDLVAEEAHRAILFVKKHDLITVPPLCEETWRLTMLSPEAQKTMPYVAYSGQNMMVAYAKEDMKQEDKLMSMRGNNRHFTHITTPHELIPGHHLQHFVASRSRTYRSNFSTPFLVEGWSLYWEMLLWDLDYGKTP